jgi:DNA replication and repair protein RecF
VSDLQQDTLHFLLQQNWSKDIALLYNTVGVHRDELQLKIGNYPARKLGSQGQQKTVLLALKLAQVDVLKQHFGIAPILLLDDIFDKLDGQRIKYLMDLVATGNFGLIFLTDSNKDRVNTLLHNVSYEYKLFEIKNGEIV